MKLKGRRTKRIKKLKTIVYWKRRCDPRLVLQCLVYTPSTPNRDEVGKMFVSYSSIHGFPHVRPDPTRITHLLPPHPPMRLKALYGDSFEKENKKNDNKPLICTADELHYVSVPNSDWTLALWRYLPSPQVLPPSQFPPYLLQLLCLIFV